MILILRIINYLGAAFNIASFKTLVIKNTNKNVINNAITCWKNAEAGEDSGFIKNFLTRISINKTNKYKQT